MKHIAKIINAVLFIALMTGLVFVFSQQARKMQGNLNEANQKLAVSEQKILALEKRIEEVANDKSVVIEETVRREVIREKSQEELLTAAVARVAPTVVSIVVTKDVPKLVVSYENPFGNDPFFKDVGIRVPVWRQQGFETQKTGAGTGFLIRSNGYILTNRHVVADNDSNYTVLLSDGSQKIAQVIHRDSTADIAILKIDGTGYKIAELGNSGALSLGQSVFAVGNALGEYSNSVSVGIISGLNRAIEASGGGTIEKLSGVIQTDAAINPGNSGGPLVDLNGNVIGINVATVVGSSNISFSIPINSAKNIISSAIK